METNAVVVQMTTLPISNFINPLTPFDADEYSLLNVSQKTSTPT